METISQTCPQCSATLELPSSAMGKMARCPACQATFRIEVPGTPQGQGTPSGHDIPQGQPWGMPAQPVSKATDPTFPTTKPPQTGYSENPYSVNMNMASAIEPPAEKGEIRVVTAKIDDIFSTSWALFTARWQPLILAGLIVFGLTFVFGFVLGGLGVLAAPGGPLADYAEALRAATIVMQAFIGLLGWYLYIGLAVVGLCVARGQDVSPMRVFISPVTFLRSFVIILPLIAFGLLPSLLMPNFQQGQTPGFAQIFTVLGVSMGVSLVQAFFLFFVWPTFFLAADGRGGGFSIIGTAFSIASRNLLNGFLLGLILMACGIIAGLTCGLGGIATSPFTALLGSVAYLLMTSQKVNRPHQTPYITPNYESQNRF